MRFLTRVQLGGFRCYAAADIELDHLNIFIGPNNSGKSAVLHSIRRLASVDLNRHARVAERAGMEFWSADTQLTLAPGDIRDAAEESRMTLEFGADIPLPHGTASVARVHARFDPRRGTSLWIDGEKEPQDQGQVNHGAEAMIRALEALPIIVIPETRGIASVLPLRNQQDDSKFHEEVVDATCVMPAIVQWACEDPARIPAFVATASDLAGEAITVTAVPSVPTLRVRVGVDSSRDIRDLGAGILEVLTLSAALTLYERGLLLYEEPELHLHPRIQRRILEKLRERARTAPWQMLVTTHSNHVLDTGLDDGVSVFAVVRANGASRLEQVTAGPDRQRMHDLFEALGVRPSSGLQPQALIWVEGPSVATYLRLFLRIAAPELTEYVDYSFAFFGGSLLTHHVASSTHLDGLVDLVGIHRNSFVVFDSDRASDGSPLGKDYAREFQLRSDLQRLWISWGREIENYLRDEVLCWAAANSSAVECSPTLASLDRRFTIFADQVASLRDACGRERSHQDASEGNKARFAAVAVQKMREDAKTDWLDIGDLRMRIGTLVEFIRRART